MGRKSALSLVQVALKTTGPRAYNYLNIFVGFVICPHFLVLAAELMAKPAKDIPPSHAGVTGISTIQATCVGWAAGTSRGCAPGLSGGGRARSPRRSNRGLLSSRVGSEAWAEAAKGEPGQGFLVGGQRGPGGPWTNTAWAKGGSG